MAKHITYTERLIIEKLYNQGASYRAVANKINRAVSSVYKEIQRGLYDHLDSKTYTYVRRYSATIADDDAQFKATAKGKQVKLGHNYDYAYEVSRRIKNGESPDSIVGDKRIKCQWTVSTVTLYRYIDQGWIPGVTNRDLLVKRKRKRTYHRVKASRPPRGTSIERRPEKIDLRAFFGDWEMDTVVGKAKGKGQTLLVLTERKTRYEIIRKLADKTAASVTKSLDRILRQYGQDLFQTITVDNGTEFSDCHGMEFDKWDNRRTTVYYCHPYSSFERGSNENANKIIRRFLPKGKSLHSTSQADCDAIADYMNNMHRKILGYYTAAELFQQEVQKMRQAAGFNTCEL